MSSASMDKTRLVRRIGYVEDAFDRFAINRALAAQLHLDSAQVIYVQEDHFYLQTSYLCGDTKPDNCLEYYDSYAHCCKLTAVRN